MRKQIEQRMKIGKWLWEQEEGTISPEHKVELQKWLDESPEHTTLAQSIRDDFKKQISNNLQEPEIAWETFESRYLLPKKINFRGLLKYAAAVVFLLLMVGGYLLWHNPTLREESTIIAIATPNEQVLLLLGDGRKVEFGQKAGRWSVSDNSIDIVQDDNSDVLSIIEQDQSEILLNTIFVPKYGEFRMKLPDGSTVTINSKSNLKYPSHFADNIREVWLEGEAFFEVVEQKGAPFIVHFGSGDTEVLGTKFNIEAYPERLLNHVTLIEGSVRCSTNEQSQKILPGEQATIETGSEGIVVSDADIRMITAWMRNQFYFKNRRLEDIMNHLSDWYNFNVVYSNPNLKEMLFTVEVTKYDDMSKLLDFMSETGKIKYKQEGRNIIIY